MRSGSCTSIRAMSKAVIWVSFRPLNLKCKVRLWSGRSAGLTANASPLTAVAKAASTAHTMLSIARRRGAQPTLEGPGEGALLGKPCQEGNLGKRMALVAQEAFGQVTAGVFGQGLEADPMLGQPTVERSCAEPEVARNVGHLRRALAERLRDSILCLTDESHLCSDFGQLGIEVRGEIAGKSLVTENVRLRQRLRRKQDRVQIRTEPDGTAEPVLVHSYRFRGRMPDQDFQRDDGHRADLSGDGDGTRQRRLARQTHPEPSFAGTV